jgi:thioredoxin reductase (NADPH)
MDQPLDPAFFSLADAVSAPLDAHQVDALRPYGAESGFSAGDVLYAAGDERVDLIVLLDGTVDGFEAYGQQGQRRIVSFGPHQFLGEMRVLTGQRAAITAVARSDGRLLRVSVAQVHTVMAQDPELSELFLRTFLLRHTALTHMGTGLTLIGSRFDTDTRRLLEVLARNRLASRWMDLEQSPDAEVALCELHVPTSDLPIVLVPGRPLLKNPSTHALLDALGIAGSSEPLTGVCDLLIVGGGPGGLAAAVYGASEGMATTLAEGVALGGQAGTSSRIENYLGFPAGLSGEELAARAALQAEKFGVHMKLASNATALTSGADVHRITFDDGETVVAKSVIIATGATYNRLPLDGIGRFEGASVYYAATQIEAEACRGEAVAIVGGGNSAGQAALFLSRTRAQVHMIIRGPTLSTSMSRYLIDEIEQSPGITVKFETQVTGLVGDQRLEGLEVLDSRRQERSILPVRALFIFIGATPCTEWLGDQLAQDSHGFLVTGRDVPAGRIEGVGWTPLFLETSRPGIFCVGDARSGSVKRVATAIGEGSMAVRLVFERLSTAAIGGTEEAVRDAAASPVPAEG